MDTASRQADLFQDCCAGGVRVAVEKSDGVVTGVVLLDAGGAAVVPVDRFLAHVLASGGSPRHRHLRGPVLRAVDAGPGEPARRRRDQISPEAHATCPGRAVTITYDWDWAPGAEAAYRAAHGLTDEDDLADVEFADDEDARAAGFVPGWQIGRHLCTDPQQYGHANVHGTPGQTPTQGQQTAEDEAAEAARKTEERRRVRQRNTEWRAATETRTSHLKALLGRKAPPVGAVKLIVDAMARGETQPQMSSFGHQTACELLGLVGNGAATGHRDLLLAELGRASEKRAQVIALAMVLGAAEHGVRDVHTWQSAENRYWASYGVPQAARYLTWLAEHTDYPLSDIEAEVAAHATSQAGSGPSEPAGEARPGAGQPDDDGDPVTSPDETETS